VVFVNQFRKIHYIPANIGVPKDNKKGGSN